MKERPKISISRMSSIYWAGVEYRRVFLQNVPPPMLAYFDRCPITTSKSTMQRMSRKGSFGITTKRSPSSSTKSNIPELKLISYSQSVKLTEANLECLSWPKTSDLIQDQQNNFQNFSSTD